MIRLTAVLRFAGLLAAVLLQNPVASAAAPADLSDVRLPPGIGRLPQIAEPRQPVALEQGQLLPSSGGWGDFVRVRGNGFGAAEAVRALWFRNDDESQPPLLSQSVTLYRRLGPDEIEIIVPADPARSGWSEEIVSGVVRILVQLPGRLQPVLAGRYLVQGASQDAGAAAEITRVVSTPALQSTGRRFGPRQVEVAALRMTRNAFAMRTVETAALQMIRTGYMTRDVATAPLEMSRLRFSVRTVITDPLRLRVSEDGIIPPTDVRRPVIETFDRGSGRQLEPTDIQIREELPR